MPATSDRILLLVIGGALAATALTVGAWVALAPAEPEALGDLDLPDGTLAALASTPPLAADEIVVDVEGAVLQPGLHRLAPGARVADALDAAGGYAPDADLDAAAQRLNLAAPLADGEQLRVPRIGETAAPAATDGGATGGTGSTGGGLLNLNTASPEELDALPGIGPVTVQKIVAARAQAPFASLEDAVRRDALNNGQLEKIRDLATV